MTTDDGQEPSGRWQVWSQSTPPETAPMDRTDHPLASELDTQFASLSPSRDVSRRTFVGTAVGGGFAAAVLPVSAQTITTSADGLNAGAVTIRNGDFDVPAYAAAPAGKSHRPVVLVVPEIFGLHEHIRDVARRFAKLGYMAVAFEPFARQGDAASYTDISTLMKEVIAKVPDAQVMGDLDAVVAWAGQHGGDTARLGIGRCWPVSGPEVDNEANTPVQTVHADFPHTAYRWSVGTQHYAALL